MHYCCLLITKEFPSKSVIENHLEQFSEDKFYSQEDENAKYPVFLWDWWQVGGRYAGMLKLSVVGNEETYGWDYYQKDHRNGRLFRSFLLDRMETFARYSDRYYLYCEEDYLMTLGFRDGFLRVDGAKISDITNFSNIGCYYCVDADGNAIARESWNGSVWEKDADFDKKLEEVMDKSKDYFACIIDIHS